MSDDEPSRKIDRSDGTDDRAHPETAPEQAQPDPKRDG